MTYGSQATTNGIVQALNDCISSSHDEWIRAKPWRLDIGTIPTEQTSLTKYIDNSNCWWYSFHYWCLSFYLRLLYTFIFINWIVWVFLTYNTLQKTIPCTCWSILLTVNYGAMKICWITIHRIPNMPNLWFAESPFLPNFWFVESPFYQIYNTSRLG